MTKTLVPIRVWAVHVFCRHVLLFSLGVSTLAATAVHGGGTVTNAVESELLAALSGGGLVKLAFKGTIVLSDTIVVAQPTILDAAGYEVTLSGGGKLRLFTIPANSSLGLTNVLLVNGRSTNGAAVFNQGVLTAVSCRFSSNVVAGLQVAGGAIFNQGTAGLEACALDNNVAKGLDRVWSSVSGGAIYNGGTLSLFSCYLSTNQCGGIDCVASIDTTGPGYGGALYNAETAYVNSTTFAYNTAKGMDAVDFPAGHGYGGAVYSSGPLWCTNSTFYGNQARGGDATATSLWTLYSAKSGEGYGGAVYVRSESSAFSFCTLVGNAAGNGATAFVETNAVLALHSSILAQNSTQFGYAIDAEGLCGTITDLGYNFCSESGAPLTNATSVKGIDPELRPLGDYGGKVPTVALLPTSPAINLGDNTIRPAQDQRGVARPQHGASDPGAFELESAWPRVVQFTASSFLAVEQDQMATVSVTCRGNPTGLVTVVCSTADGSAQAGLDYVATNLTLSFATGETSKSFKVQILPDTIKEDAETVNLHLSNLTGPAVLTSPQDSIISIREAATDVTSVGELQAAVAAGGEITFSSSGVFLVPNTLVITNHVTIDGGRKQVTLAVQYQRLLEVRSGGRLGLKNLTLTGGNARQGGALLNNGGEVVIEGCQFLGNIAAGAPSSGDGAWAKPAEDARGGAIMNGGGVMVIQNSLFATNRCTGGSGSGDHYGYGAPGFGGAIFNSGTLYIAQTTIGRNSVLGGGGTELWGRAPVPAHAYGGAVCNWGFLTMTNVTLVENEVVAGLLGNYFFTPEAWGGALYNTAGTAIVQNVTMASNLLTVFQPSRYHAGRPRGYNIGNSNGLVYVCNTILAGARDATNCDGTLMDLGHNLSTDGSGGLTNASSRQWADPKLLPLGDNGGLTPTMALLPDSPAIDQGLTVAGVNTDQRGVARPYGPAPDIGAYEWNDTSHYPSFWLSSPRLINSRCYLTGWGPTNGWFRILASENMRDWTTVTNASTGVGGSILVKESEPTGSHARFYRIVAP